MNVAQSPGERLLEEYLAGRGLVFQIEPDVGGRNPDFVVEIDSATVGMEVYEPELRLPQNVAGVISTPTALRRGFERRKYEQARAVAERGWPFVLVVARTYSDIDFDPLLAASAMYGDLQVSFKLDTGTDETTESSLGFGQGARIQPQMKRAISAVALIRRLNPTAAALAAETRLALETVRADDPDQVQKMLAIGHDIEAHAIRTKAYDPDATAVRLVVLHNPFATNSLDLGFFNGPRDVQWSVLETDQGTMYGPVATGIEAKNL